MDVASDRRRINVPEHGLFVAVSEHISVLVFLFNELQDALGRDPGLDKVGNARGDQTLAVVSGGVGLINTKMALLTRLELPRIHENMTLFSLAVAPAKRYRPRPSYIMTVPPSLALPSLTSLTP
jgi:hypothetical protein